jgi:hypothetical protein
LTSKGPAAPAAGGIKPASSALICGLASGISQMAMFTIGMVRVLSFLLTSDTMLTCTADARVQSAHDLRHIKTFQMPGTRSMQFKDENINKLMDEVVDDIEAAGSNEQGAADSSETSASDYLHSEDEFDLLVESFKEPVSEPTESYRKPQHKRKWSSTSNRVYLEIIALTLL